MTMDSVLPGGDAMMTESIRQLEKLASEAIRAEEGDYLVDGLLHCGKCHTPKQSRFDTAWGIRVTYHLCECGMERRVKAEQQKADDAQMERISKLRDLGFPDEEMRNWTFEADDMANRKLTTVMHRYVDKFQEMRNAGKGLLLFGDVGVGKSFYAACAVNALIDSGVPCLMTSFLRLTNKIQERFEGRQEYIDSLNRFKLLTIDDLGVERMTGTMNEMVYAIIDSRYRSKLPLIVTTNLTADELKNPTDVHKARIYSRLMEMCIPIEVKGRDRRKEKLKRDFSTFEELLGL